MGTPIGTLWALEGLGGRICFVCGPDSPAVGLNQSMTYDGAPGPVTTDGFIAAQALTVVGAPPVGYEWAVFGAQFTVTLASVTRNLGPFTVWFWVSQGANLMVVGIAGDCTSRVFDELVIRRGNGSV